MGATNATPLFSQQKKFFIVISLKLYYKYISKKRQNQIKHGKTEKSIRN